MKTRELIAIIAGIAGTAWITVGIIGCVEKSNDAEFKLMQSCVDQGGVWQHDRMGIGNCVFSKQVNP